MTLDRNDVSGRRGNWPNRIGTPGDCLDNMPHSLLMTSRARKGWEDVVFDVHPGSGRFELDLPPLDHYVIMVARSGGPTTEGIVDGRAYRHAVECADINIYPAFMRHSCWGDATPEALATSIPANLCGDAIRSLSDGRASELIVEPIIAARDPVLKHLHEILLAELQVPSHPAQRMFVGAMQNAIAIHLVRLFGHLAPVSPHAVRKLPVRTMAVIRDYLETHLTDPVKLEDLAAIAGLSRFHFARAFKETASMTPMQYVERIRISRAKELLEKGAMSIADIAHLIGFSDQSHFTRRFKLQVGCTPGNYARSRISISVHPHPLGRDA